MIPAKHHSKYIKGLFFEPNNQRGNEGIDSLTMPPNDDIFLMKPLVKCTHCDHITPIHLGDTVSSINRTYPQRSKSTLHQRYPLTFPNQGQQKFEYFGRNQEAENIPKSDSFGSDLNQKAGPANKNEKLPEYHSEFNIKRGESSERVNHSRTNTIAPPPNLSQSSSLPKALFTQKKKIWISTQKPNLFGQAMTRRSELFHLLLSQLRLPEKEFAEELVLIHNKFLLQSGRGLSVGICNSCESSYPLSAKFSHHLNSHLTVSSPAQERTPNLTSNHIQYGNNDNSLQFTGGSTHSRMREPMGGNNNNNGNISNSNSNGNLMPSPIGLLIKPVSASSRNKESTFHNRSRQSSFPSGTLLPNNPSFQTNSEEPTKMPFCFCNYCQTRLMKKTKQSKRGKNISKREQDKKLRMNRVYLEYKDLNLRSWALEGKGDGVKKFREEESLSLSEKIMKGVIDNLLLKSLNDSSNEVRIQTLHSLNSVSSDFIHYLVSGKPFSDYNYNI